MLTETQACCYADMSVGRDKHHDQFKKKGNLGFSAAHLPGVPGERLANGCKW